MNLKLVRFSVGEKKELECNLIAYFLETDATKVMDNGTLHYPYIDLYWEEPNRIPLKIIYDNKLVGFVLINDFVVHKEYGASKSIAEFYIQPSYRGLGIGKNAGHQIFNDYNGKWEVRQSLCNIEAQKFWRKIISEYTQNNFTELLLNNEYIQLFHS